MNQYPRENLHAMYNLLGSHDTERIKTLLKGDQKKLALAYLFLFAYPGAPAIFYGDEVGLEGGKDPGCRKAFPWNEGSWDRDLRKLIQQLIAIRKNKPALRRGTFQEVFKDGKRGGYGFARVLGEESLLMVLNASGTRQQYRLDVAPLNWQDGRIVRDLIKGEELSVSGSELALTLEAWTGLWVV
jgi:glycosidase